MRKQEIKMTHNPLVSTMALAAMMIVASVASPSLSVAQPAGLGPVGGICSSDIQKFCRELRHGRGEIRSCLERNRARVSPACRRALDTTGGGAGWRAPR
jgi:hypothetical protein